MLINLTLRIIISRRAQTAIEEKFISNEAIRQNAQANH